MLASVENKSELGENTELMLFKTHIEATSIPFSLSLSQMPKKGFELFTLQLNILDVSTHFCSPLHDLGHAVCPWPSCDQPNRPPTIARFWSRSHGLGGKQTQLTKDDRLGALPKNDVAQLHSRLAFLTLLHCLCTAFIDLRKASFIDVTLVNCGSKLDADISRPLFAHAFLTWFRLASVFLHPFSGKEMLGISRFSSEAYTVLSFAVLWHPDLQMIAVMQTSHKKDCIELSHFGCPAGCHLSPCSVCRPRQLAPIARHKCHKQSGGLCLLQVQWKNTNQSNQINQTISLIIIMSHISIEHKPYENIS